MRVNLTLQQLEAFLSVAGTGNFRSAAQALQVSQPSLSRTIRLAEETLGTRLFDRDTRHVALTPAGSELLPIARRILSEFDSAFSELGQFLEGRRGHVTVAALPSVGVALLPQAYSRLRKRQPEIGFSLEEELAEPLLHKVDEGQADFGLTVRPRASDPVRYTHLFDDPFVLICRRDDPLAQLDSVSWKVFTKRPFLGSASQGSVGPIVDRVFVRLGLEVPSVFNYPSIAIGGAMVAEGIGITAVPRLALPLIASNAVAAVPLVSPALHRQIGIVTRVGRSLSPAARGLVQQLIQDYGPGSSATDYGRAKKDEN